VSAKPTEGANLLPPCGEVAAKPTEVANLLPTVWGGVGEADGGGEPSRN
jgi:hypothetical protein